MHLSEDFIQSKSHFIKKKKDLIGANTAHMKQMSEELMNGQQMELILTEDVV